MITQNEQPVRISKWGNLTLETRYETGYAARSNRRSYSGTKVHRIACQYIVGVDEGSEVPAGSLGARFLATGKPVLFSSYPMCGCTQGQHAAKPVAGAVVTCKKCGG